MICTVIGGGSWGTALASVLAVQHEVRLWARDQKIVDGINQDHRNPNYLHGLDLPIVIQASIDLNSVLFQADLVVLVVPSHVMRSTLRNIKDLIPAHCLIVSASKGIENDSLDTMHQVLLSELPSHLHSQLAFLSGPSFAKETVLKQATAVTVAAIDLKVAQKVQQIMTTRYFRIYTSDDVVGVELGGALKNVIAIAAGVADGLGLGYNTRAALMTRGVAEITRLALKLGAHPLTLSGLAGMGDLVLTCTGGLSRNRQVGVALGQGKSLSEILHDMNQVAEGIKTTLSAYKLAQREQIEMPIVQEVYAMLYQQKPAPLVLKDLMSRDLKEERV
jgi:glycerol-3-phosphate dehydrogenase (NAD(P)+)